MGDLWINGEYLKLEKYSYLGTFLYIQSQHKTYFIPTKTLINRAQMSAITNLLFNG